VLATKRGVDYIRQAGLSPQESLDLWNQSLGTKFGMADYERVMKQFPAAQQPARTRTFRDADCRAGSSRYCWRRQDVRWYRRA
jgi:hypothetical protein